MKSVSGNRYLYVSKLTSSYLFLYLGKLEKYI
jgi:hypothetical protein